MCARRASAADGYYLHFGAFGNMLAKLKAVVLPTSSDMRGSEFTPAFAAERHVEMLKEILKGLHGCVNRYGSPCHSKIRNIGLGIRKKTSLVRKIPNPSLISRLLKPFGGEEKAQDRSWHPTVTVSAEAYERSHLPAHLPTHSNFHTHRSGTA